MSAEANVTASLNNLQHIIYMAKILIVDDERSIRRTLRDILEFEKYKVDEAGDGVECLVKVQKLSLIHI